MPETLANPQASVDMSADIARFRYEKDMGEEDIEIHAAERRVDEAEQTRQKIAETVGEANEDHAVADFMTESVETNKAAALGLQEALAHSDALETIHKVNGASVEDLGEALSDLQETEGPDVVESLIELIEDSTQESAPDTEDAMWKKLMSATENHAQYTNSNAKTSRIPLSLPMRSEGGYNPDAIQYASSNEMEDILTGYGLSSDVIETAKENNWEVPLEAMPNDLLKTIIAADTYEAIARSHDPEMKKQASERNDKVTLEDIWKDSTLHHVTDANHLDSILENGQLGYILTEYGVQNTGGVQDGNINFGAQVKELAENASNQDRMNALSYNDRGNIYIHYARPEGAYREGDEYDGDRMKLMPGGLPSTEISALMLKKDNDGPSLERVGKL